MKREVVKIDDALYAEGTGFSDIEKHIHLQDIHAAIRTLKGQHKQVFELYYYEDLTFKQCAIIMRISESYAFILHREALKIVKQYMCYNKTAAA